jgi:NADH:ubiquinone oxidoreductase subunit D
MDNSNESIRILTQCLKSLTANQLKNPQLLTDLYNSKMKTNVS